MIATREFQYYDHQRRVSVKVPAGASIDSSALAVNVDVQKLVRTKYLEDSPSASEVVAPKRKRGRPRKER